MSPNIILLLCLLTANSKFENAVFKPNFTNTENILLYVDIYDSTKVKIEHIWFMTDTIVRDQMYLKWNFTNDFPKNKVSINNIDSLIALYNSRVPDYLILKQDVKRLDTFIYLNNKLYLNGYLYYEKLNKKEQYKMNKNLLYNLKFGASNKSYSLTEITNRRYSHPERYIFFDGFWFISYFNMGIRANEMFYLNYMNGNKFVLDSSYGWNELVYKEYKIKMP